MSLVKHLYVRFEGSESIVCMCEPDKYKICKTRQIDDCECVEAIVRVSPIERDSQKYEDKTSGSDKRLRRIGKTLLDVEKHLKMFR